MPAEYVFTYYSIQIGLQIIKIVLFLWYARGQKS